jgi:hypothetical protein
MMSLHYWLSEGEEKLPGKMICKPKPAISTINKMMAQLTGLATSFQLMMSGILGVRLFIMVKLRAERQHHET